MFCLFDFFCERANTDSELLQNYIIIRNVCDFERKSTLHKQHSKRHISAQWQSAGLECGRSQVQSPVKDRVLDSLVVQCWLGVREVPGSIPSQGPRPRQPSGRVLASSAESPKFNPQSRTASSIAQWQSAGFKCGRSQVQSPVKDRLLDSLVVECWLRVREVTGSIPSQGPPPLQPSGRVLASSTGGPGFNPQSRTASYQRCYKIGTNSALVQH